MKLNAHSFGEIEIEKEDIITFPDGIPGFENLKQYIIINNPDEENPFQWLQSVDNGDLAFVIINPFFVKPDYDIVIPQSAIDKLKIEDEKDVFLYTLVVVPEKLEDMTVNLSAPIVINGKERLGRQIILEDKKYKTRHYIFKTAESRGE